MDERKVYKEEEKDEEMHTGTRGEQGVQEIQNPIVFDAKV